MYAQARTPEGVPLHAPIRIGQASAEGVKSVVLNGRYLHDAIKGQRGGARLQTSGTSSAPVRIDHENGETHVIMPHRE